MHRIFLAASMTALLAVAGAASAAEGPRVGAAAPDFTVTDSNGKAQSLSAYKGKTVVMEWTNDGCPYVRKHYNSGNMQALQKKYTGEGVVWLTVASSPEGEQGYVTAADANRDTQTRNASPTAVLLDSKSSIARLYQARNTPLMVVIDPAGEIAYMGAIDDKPTASLEDVKGAHNYVAAALDALQAGKPIAVSSTRAYGCYVKYAPQS